RGVHLGEALGSRRISAPAGGILGQIGGAGIHSSRIPKPKLIATHLQLHLADEVPTRRLSAALSGSGWVWPSSGADTGANTTLQEMRHVKPASPPRHLQPPRLVQPGGAIGRADRAGRGP